MLFPILLFVFAVIAIVLLFSGFWPTFFGAPWVPTSRERMHTMLQLADVGPDDVVYDLGCGDGRMVIAAAREYGARAVGIEIEPLKYVWCQLRITELGLRDQVTVKLGNLFTYDLSDATVVICYLLKETNQQLFEKLQRELPARTRVISNIFTFPGIEPVKEADNALLYIFNADD